MGAPTIATSTPASSAGSSVYGIPENDNNPAKSGFSPYWAQRASGSIMGPSSHALDGAGAIAETDH